MLFTMSKPRIIGGTAKGRELDTPASGTRPSPARLREALFSVLAFEPHGEFLDLYSGSGAIGLEAASRGWWATCVELSGKAAAVIQGNAKRLGLNVTVVRGDALAHADAHPGHYQVLFAAPPYPDDLQSIFARLLASGAVAPGGLYVLQHPSAMTVPELPPALTDASVRVKRYGTNSVTFVRVPEAGA